MKQTKQISAFERSELPPPEAHNSHGPNASDSAPGPVGVAFPDEITTSLKRQFLGTYLGNMDQRVNDLMFGLLEQWSIDPDTRERLYLEGVAAYGEHGHGNPAHPARPELSVPLRWLLQQPLEYRQALASLQPQNVATAIGLEQMAGQWSLETTAHIALAVAGPWAAEVLLENEDRIIRAILSPMIAGNA